MREMEKGKKDKGRIRVETVVRVFYMLTLCLWCLWVLFQITAFHRTQLLPIPAAFLFFYTTSNFFFRRHRYNWDPLLVNTSVSLLHSSLSSSFVVFIVVNQWISKPSSQLFDHYQLVHRAWPWAYPALCFSSGYFAYDQWDMLRYRLYTGSFPSILAHHFILLLCFTLALYRHITINYLILTLICELHSVFLHVRKLRRMAGIRNAERSIVKVEWFLNWLTFFFARLIPHALILIKLLRDAPKFDKGIQLPLACFGMVAMNALNIGLAIDLLGAFKKENKSSAQSS